ncbi:Clp protease N-terminal domain-containing protein [Streptomyces sp. NPDC045251]|uniref:Clp protease N-terminal domain-containing protein n=1 Tax=unclassified Streptomyces TaxID=2593676 RepID=UPI0033ECC921
MSAQLDSLADQLVGHFVDEARSAGVTWAEIGQILGVSRQAAQKRFVPRTTPPGTLDAAVYDRFTPRARAVLTASEDEARTAGHAYLGTEHIALGLLSQPDGLAARYLLERTTPERVRQELGKALGPRSDEVPEQLSYTPRGMRAVEMSAQEAQRLGHQYVGTEHLLLGVLSDRHGIGGKVLLGLGADQQGLEEFLAAT